MLAKCSLKSDSKKEEPIKYSLYHPNFRKRREAVFAEFGNTCMRCGIHNRSIAFNRDGDIYIVYLHSAHVFANEKMEADAYLIPLCPRCHWYFDHPRENPPGSLADWAFIGTVARYFIEKESRTTGRQEEVYGDFSS